VEAPVQTGACLLPLLVQFEGCQVRRLLDGIREKFVLFLLSQRCGPKNHRAFFLARFGKGRGTANQSAHKASHMCPERYASYRTDGLRNCSQDKLLANPNSYCSWGSSQSMELIAIKLQVTAGVPTGRSSRLTGKTNIVPP
jgi:hypothetical protein